MTIQTMIDPHKLLADKFGWDEFKPGQLQVVESLLNGRSALAVFPTGGGKSLCYQLPALAFDGLTVVVSPLIALMKDQIDQLASRGVTAIRLDSSLSAQEYRDGMEAIRSGTAKILYVAPERFFNERFRASLGNLKISLFAIDEAHCISQWGHNFRPEYLKLARIAQQLKVERVLALTATATPQVQSDIQQAFEIADNDMVVTPFYRPNLHLRLQLTDDTGRMNLLTRRLKPTAAQAESEISTGPTIVYVTLQKTAEEIAEHCQHMGLPAKAYHAGMKPEQRSSIQEWFMEGDDRIVVATIAFGMGIDKSNIRAVYHYNPAKSLENYAQEIGRAGRDGNESICESWLVPSDRTVLQNFVYGDTPAKSGLRQFIQFIANQEPEFHVSLYRLSSDCDIKQLVLKTLLTYLELDGYLDSIAPRYNSYMFIPQTSSASILANFDGERRGFVSGLLKCSTKAKKWFSIDIEQACQQLNTDRSRVIKALDYLGEQGWLQLKVSGLTHGFRKTKPLDNQEDLVEGYFERIMEREQGEIERVEQIFDLAIAGSCQAAILSDHFGQEIETDCGVCSFCRGDSEAADVNHSVEPTGEQLDAWNNRMQALTGKIQSKLDEAPSVLGNPRSLAKYLCGLTSPALTRARLTRDELFGTASEIPFDSILEFTETLC